MEFQTAEEYFDLETIERYYWQLRTGEKLQPVLVYSDGQTRWLADGFHRVRAMQRMGRKTIEVEIVQGTLEDIQKRWNEMNDEIRRNLRADKGPV